MVSLRICRGVAAMTCKPSACGCHSTTTAIQICPHLAHATLEVVVPSVILINLDSPPPTLSLSHRHQPPILRVLPLPQRLF